MNFQSSHEDSHEKLIINISKKILNAITGNSIKFHHKHDSDSASHPSDIRGIIMFGLCRRKLGTINEQSIFIQISDNIILDRIKIITRNFSEYVAVG